ncbi:MAG: hypothetical protein ACKVG6_13715 [Alphaproteobacteria bacterium]
MAEQVPRRRNARFLKRDAKFPEWPKRQTLPTPAHHIVDLWDRSTLHNPRKRLVVGIIKLRRLVGALP